MYGEYLQNEEVCEGCYSRPQGKRGQLASPPSAATNRQLSFEIRTEGLSPPIFRLGFSESSKEGDCLIMWLCFSIL